MWLVRGGACSVPGRGCVASAALCRDGKSATPAERGRRFGEGPATAGGRGLSAGWPAVVEDARARSIGGSSSSRVRAWAVPFSAVLCRVLWFPCSRCSGLSATRRLAVGRVRRARFRRKIVVALSLLPRDGTERVVAEDVYYRLGHSGPVTVIEASSQVLCSIYRAKRNFH